MKLVPILTRRALGLDTTAALGSTKPSPLCDVAV